MEEHVEKWPNANVCLKKPTCGAEESTKGTTIQRIQGETLKCKSRKQGEVQVNTSSSCTQDFMDTKGFFPSAVGSSTERGSPSVLMAHGTGPFQ